MASQTFTPGTVVTNAWFVDANSLVWGVFNGATSATLARTALGLTSLATMSASNVTLTGGTITGITDLAVADGGTGSSTAANARTALSAAASGANTDITSLTGTATNDSAASGKIGEYISGTLVFGSAVSLVNNTAKTVTSISLTAGDWDVNATLGLALAGTTTVSLVLAAIGQTNNAVPAFNDTNGGGVYYASGPSGGTIITGGAYLYPIGTQRVSLSATTTIYLTCNILFAVAAASAYGFIGARRAR